MSEHHRLHPGQVLQNELLMKTGRTTYWLSVGLDMQQTAVADILKGKRAITPGVALRLEKFLGVPAEFWLSLQAAFDVDLEREKMQSKGQLDRIKPALADDQACAEAMRKHRLWHQTEKEG